MPESNVHKLADESAAENAADNVSSPPQLTVVDPADCLAEAEVIYNYGGFDGKSPLFPCAKEYWYEEGSRRFWLKNAAGEWVDMNSSEFERELRMLGCRAVKLVKEGETSSPLEKVMADIQKNRRVWYAGELAGHKAGIYTLQGKKVLITQSPQLMVPVAGEWANLKKYLENLLVDAESKTDQLIYLHAWVQHTLERLYSGKWAKPGGLCLGVAGPTDCGKTLLTMLLQVLFGGKVANPYEWMIGRDAFNEEMFEACLQLIDDEVADTSIKGRLALAAKIKIMTATGRGRCRGMQKKAVNLAPVWRLMICTNDEPDRLLILPPLDDDIVDKLLLLRAYKRPMPWPASTNADELAAWNGLLGELPHYVHWLLHEFKIPGNCMGALA